VLTTKHNAHTSPELIATDDAYCPYFHHVIELIGRRWTGAILLALSREPSRFSRLRQQIPGLSDRLLSERIAELEAEGIVERHQVDEHTLYQLTDKGNGLRPVIDAIETFAKTTSGEDRLPDHPGRRCDPTAARR
jgi:DNA-binding HxlR family transcriptional regulator